MIAIVFIAMGSTLNPQNHGFSVKIAINGPMILVQVLTRIILMYIPVIIATNNFLNYLDELLFVKSFML